MHHRLRMPVLAILLLGSIGLCRGQTAGQAALRAFLEWKSSPGNSTLEWEEALRKYRAKLEASGLSGAAAEKTIRLVVAYDEAEGYNRVYAEPPRFNTLPNRFLVDAIEDLAPGAALDVGMGQGRNAVHLALKGWRVTGFDVAEVGLKQARERAAAAGVAIDAVHASDEEYAFGQERWDLIVIIHAIENRSVFRVRPALKPGGHVIIEAAHKEPGGYLFGYESNALLKIFEGFRILRYEERTGIHDFSDDRNRRERLVRLLAQKPR